MSSVSDIDASLGPLDVQPPPKPSITGPGIGLAAAGWVLYALLYTFFIVRQPSGPPFVPVFLGQLLNSLTLAVYSLPVWWITVRQMDQWHWGWTLAAHLLIGPLYSWVGLESYLAFIRRIGGPGAAAEMTATISGFYSARSRSTPSSSPSTTWSVTCSACVRRSNRPPSC